MASKFIKTQDIMEMYECGRKSALKIMAEAKNFTKSVMPKGKITVEEWYRYEHRGTEVAE